MDGTTVDPNGITWQQQDEFPDNVADVSHKDAAWWLCPMQHACVCDMEGVAQR